MEIGNNQGDIVSVSEIGLREIPSAPSWISRDCGSASASGNSKSSFSTPIKSIRYENIMWILQKYTYSFSAAFPTGGWEKILPGRFMQLTGDALPFTKRLQATSTDPSCGWWKLRFPPIGNH
ncbi:hypothetical protein M5K25_025183 [Dendrobium thyrsiflorum]|uniref:Uncharacterized protein n=1 Tax=Dendrobium thyrsiflorum TaxID=117978 RepID=A0ABD0U3V0_DENTH